MPRFSLQPAAPFQGIGTVGTVAQMIADYQTASILLWADTSNSGTIFIGDSAVTTGDGYPRVGGQEFEGAVQARETYVVGSAAGQVYRWLAVPLR